MRRFVLFLLVLVLVLMPSVPARADLVITVVAVSSPVRPGAPARVEILTAPAAVCDIEVRFSTGPSRAAQLRPRRADEKGRVVWLWRLGRQTPRGTWPILIDCLLGHQVGAVRTQFTVY